MSEPAAKKQLTHDLSKEAYGEVSFDWKESEGDWRHIGVESNEKRLDINGRPVMQRWETPYMKALADRAASKGGVVLEVGFGMGIAAGFIQDNDIDTHVIIEANAEVFKSLLEFQKTAKHKVVALFGFWQDVVPLLGDNAFDGILFDTYPMPDSLHTHHQTFFPVARRLLKDGGVLSFCNLTSWGTMKREKYGEEEDEKLFTETQEPSLREAGFTKFELTIIDVVPDADCEYYQSKRIVAPLCS